MLIKKSDNSQLCSQCVDLLHLRLQYLPAINHTKLNNIIVAKLVCIRADCCGKFKKTLLRFRGGNRLWVQKPVCVLLQPASDFAICYQIVLCDSESNADKWPTIPVVEPQLEKSRHSCESIFCVVILEPKYVS